ncbi:MAG: dTMP kinase [Thermoplasmata archaeon]
MAGRFITLDGIDGCGKSSVAERLFRTLEEQGRDVILTREPTDSWIGEAVKRSISEDHPALTEAFLFMADRATHSVEISEWLKGDKIVICDRYADSTICYQAASLASEGFDGDPVEWLKGISDLYVLSPDLTILLDLDPGVAMERIQQREKIAKFEKRDFLTIVRENFLRLAEMEDRIKIVDARPPFGTVAEEAERVLRTVLD